MLSRTGRGWCGAGYGPFEIRRGQCRARRGQCGAGHGQSRAGRGRCGVGYFSFKIRRGQFRAACGWFDIGLLLHAVDELTFYDQYTDGSFGMMRVMSWIFGSM